ncbi:MAG TPA: ArsR family transcriptional regulator [Nitrospirae bacterium]|nr:putative HTH-type transcriptional regulator/MT0088 [bacterium BMS3Bbin09]HDH33945.1 ArsR family transcriptional regulator [Nitrospirota bacterium]HDO66793.1 ArsR family transcriptional regulator [Nitrospirota bacterium]HEW80967.1 ArsR family transcriptional regulator [Nitrospirota bacterium]
MDTLALRIEVLKLTAHPARIAILEELFKGVKCVTDIQDFMDISQSNISQHLSALRHAGIIDFFVDGRLRCYYLKDPFIPDLLMIIKKEYPNEIPGPECCPITKKGKYPGNRKH